MTKTSTSLLLDVVRATLRMHRFRIRLQRRHFHWIRRFLSFCDSPHPSELGAAQIQAFLNHIADGHGASSAAQTHALGALLFLYGDVLGIETKHYRFERIERPVPAPFLLMPLEAEALISELQGSFRVVARLLYGSGLHLRECLSLRIKDVDFGRRELCIRSRKGRSERRVALLPAVIPDLRFYLGSVRDQYEQDLLEGAGYVAIPEALRLDFPEADREWRWQWCFPAAQTHVHPVTGQRCRHHLHESVVQRAIRDAALAAHLGNHVSASTLRRSSEKYLLEGIETIDVPSDAWHDLGIADRQ